MGPEWIVVGIIAVVVLFGAKKLPEMARSVGRAQGEFKKGIKEGNVDEPTDVDRAEAATPSPQSASTIRRPPGVRPVACAVRCSVRWRRFRPPQLPGDPPEDAVHVPA